MKSSSWFLVSLVFLTFLAAALCYPYLPAQVVSHWSATGVPNGTLPKFWGTFLLPLMMAAFLIIRKVTLAVDPFKKNVQSFEGYINAFWIMLMVFFMYLFGLMMAWNFGFRFNFTFAMVPALSAFFFGVGEIIEHTKRNWFMGIRTPWTLSSEKVWSKTHQLGGRLFKFAALATLLGGFLSGATAFGIMIVSLVITVIATVAYSYIAFQNLRK